MVNNNMGVGIIGCGAHAIGFNIPHAARNPNLEIIAFCDLREDQLEKLKVQYQPDYVTTDMEKIFLDPQIGMVICVTKPDFRLPVIELAVKQKKPLFVEKPVAYTEEDTNQAVSLLRSSGVPFMVGFNRPYSPLMQALRKIYRKHKKGNTTIIYRIVGESDIWSPVNRHNVLVNKQSTLIHETTHIFDLFTWLTGLEATSVYTAGGGHMDNVVTLTYPEDITAVIIAGDNGSVGYPKERVEINSNCGTIVGEYFVELRTVGHGYGHDSGIQFFPYGWQGEQCNDGFRGVREKLFNWRMNLTEEKRNVGFYHGQIPEVDKGHYHQQEYFRKQIVTGEPVETDVVRGAMANVTAWKAMDSWKKGQPVKLDFSYLRDL